MTAAAHSPEELDTLLEDAFVLRDRGCFDALFDEAAVLGEAGGTEARGSEDIGRAIARLWALGRTYVARTRRVLRTRDTALIVGDSAIHVLRRGSDGAWRAAITLLDTEDDQDGGSMTQDTQALQPVATRGGEGEARWWFEGLAEVKVTAAQTGGLLSILEVTEPPGAATPLHVHHVEDESFWILEGDVTFEVGDTTIEATAGDFAFAPRDIPHRYTVGDGGCRLLFIVTPGGFEDLVREMSVPAERRTLPPASDAAPDMERVAAVARAHGCELLG